MGLNSQHFRLFLHIAVVHVFFFSVSGYIIGRIKPAVARNIRGIMITVYDMEEGIQMLTEAGDAHGVAMAMSLCFSVKNLTGFL